MRMINHTAQREQLLPKICLFWPNKVTRELGHATSTKTVNCHSELLISIILTSLQCSNRPQNHKQAYGINMGAGGQKVWWKNVTWVSTEIVGKIVFPAWPNKSTWDGEPTFPPPTHPLNQAPFISITGEYNIQSNKSFNSRNLRAHGKDFCLPFALLAIVPISWQPAVYFPGKLQVKLLCLPETVSWKYYHHAACKILPFIQGNARCCFYLWCIYYIQKWFRVACFYEDETRFCFSAELGPYSPTPMVWTACRWCLQVALNLVRFKIQCIYVSACLPVIAKAARKL